MITSSDVVGYKRFGGPCCFHLQGEDGGSKVLSHRYPGLQPRRPRHENVLTKYYVCTF